MVSPYLLSPCPPSIYPDSDGDRVSDNTLQYAWMMLLKGNLDALFRNRPDVFVAADLLWYPVEGEPTIRLAPDVLVALGRPAGYRGSYKQWEEEGIAPQVVFEILSPGNTYKEMIDKFHFYEEHGVEEYYVIEPDRHMVEAYHRGEATLRPVARTGEVVSPRLGIRFRVVEDQLRVFGPNGAMFRPFEEMAAELDTMRSKLGSVREELGSVRNELGSVRNEAEEARQRAARLAERLRSLGIDPNA